MMQEALTWGALVLASGSILALVKFWMDMGTQLAKADSATAIAQAALARAEVLAADLTQHKIETANRYATAAALAEAERDISHKVDGIHQRLDKVNERLDRMVEALVERRG